MAAEKKDNWTSEVSAYLLHSRSTTLLTELQAYQHSASFVPKLATKIVQWLDPQKEDHILDVGCGGKSTVAAISFILLTKGLKTGS
jgi:protein-L-isoaspartate O-methyltransferase